MTSTSTVSSTKPNTASFVSADALKKGAALASEASKVAKGNVEAFIASSRITAEETQAIVRDAVVITKINFDKSLANLTELSAARTPADLLNIQLTQTRSFVVSGFNDATQLSRAFMALVEKASAPLTERHASVTAKIGAII